MKIAAVIPCFRTGEDTLSVIQSIPSEVKNIFVVDDACPLKTGSIVEKESTDPRVKVIFHPENLGVGAAMVSGYRAALQSDCEIVVKIDGDGQMNPALLPDLLQPILEGHADYCKGNRFFDPRFLKTMPIVRLVGNALLSFINKIVSGYWNIMDPTNGFTAIHRRALEQIPLDKIESRFFFESDMLYHLYLVRAVVRDFPMTSVYGSESSNLNIPLICFRFPFKYFIRFWKRIVYSYYIRDFNAASLNLLLGSLFTGFGAFWGSYHWGVSVESGVTASSGTVMIASLPIILGFQMLLSALNFDLGNLPSIPIQKIFRKDSN